MAADSAFAAAAASFLWGRQDGYSPTLPKGRASGTKRELARI